MGSNISSFDRHWKTQPNCSSILRHLIGTTSSRRLGKWYRPHPPATKRHLARDDACPPPGRSRTKIQPAGNLPSLFEGLLCEIVCSQDDQDPRSEQARIG